MERLPTLFSRPALHSLVHAVERGSILLHVTVKLPVIRRGLGEKPDRAPTERGLSRRGFLRTTGVAVLARAGGTIPWLRGISVLATRSGGGTQGLPVNRTAPAAGPNWRLTVRTRNGIRRSPLPT